MLVPSQDGSEEGGAGGEDHFVGGELLLALACQRHVEEILIVPDLSEGNTDVSLKVIPLQTELFSRHFSKDSINLKIVLFFAIVHQYLSRSFSLLIL